MTWHDLLAAGFLRQAFVAATLAGLSCSIVGVLIVILRISFIGVCLSHAAFAGALLGVYFNLPPLPFALASGIGTAAALGPLAHRGKLSPDTTMGVLFSVMLGISFLILGLLPGSRAEGLQLLWGSVLSVGGQDIALLFSTTCATVFLAVMFFKEIHALVFSQDLAAASGLPATAVFYGLLMVAGVAVVSSLKAIGGLLVFSLMINPAAAAYQCSYRLGRIFVLAAVFGILSAWAGLAASCIWNLPAGASVILASSAIFLAAYAASPKRRRSAR